MGAIIPFDGPLRHPYVRYAPCHYYSLCARSYSLRMLGRLVRLVDFLHFLCCASLYRLSLRDSACFAVPLVYACVISLCNETTQTYVFCVIL